MLTWRTAVVHDTGFRGRCCSRYWFLGPLLFTIMASVAVAVLYWFPGPPFHCTGFWITTPSNYCILPSEGLLRSLLASGQLLLVILASGTTVLTSGTTVSRYCLLDNLLTVLASEGLLRNTGIRITVARNTVAHNTGFRDHCCSRHWL